MTCDIVLGDRFKGDDGEDFVFTIKSVSTAKMEEIRKVCSKVNSKGDFAFNNVMFNTKLAIEGTKYPNFKDAAGIAERGLKTAEEYIADVLLPGEIDILSRQIQKFNGYGVGINELVDEVKN